MPGTWAPGHQPGPPAVLGAAVPDSPTVQLPSLFPPEMGDPPEGWFATWAVGDDLDRTFDDAMDHAIHAWGEQQVPDVDPHTLVVVDPEVPLTLSQAYREARAAVAGGAQGVAVRFFAARSFRRKPVRVAVTDDDVVLPDVGALPLWDDRVDELLVAGATAVLDAQEFGPATVDTVEVVRRNVRSRATAERVQGRSYKRFAVLEDDRIVAVFDTQREARAHAVGLARTDPRDEAHWQLAALVGRVTDDGWAPLVNVLRRRRVQKAVFKVVMAQPRENPGRPGGWVFACPGTPAPTVDHRGATDEGVAGEGAVDDTPADGVPDDGVPDDGVPTDSAPVDGAAGADGPTDDQSPTGPTDAG